MSLSIYSIIYDPISKEYILKDEQHRKNVHYGVDLLKLLADEINDNVGDNTDGDTFGNTVEQGHRNNAKVSGNCACKIIVIKLKINDVCEHQKSYDDKRGSSCKGGDSYKDI